MATETSEQRNLEYKDVIFSDNPEEDSAYKVLAGQCQNGYGDYPLYGYREYMTGSQERGSRWLWQSRSEILARVHAFGDGLTHLGVEKNARIGFMSIPREEFNIVHLACSYRTFCVVSVYETLTDKIAAEVIAHCGAVVFCVHEKFIPKLQRIFEENPNLKTQIKHIIILDSRPDEVHHRSIMPRSSALFHHTFSEIEAVGRAHPSLSPKDSLAGADDITMLVYTSGTTGHPKGVMLPSKALVATGFSLQATMPKWFGEKPFDIVNISYLPYSHIFSVVMEMTIMRIKGRSGICTNGPSHILSDMESLRPTVMAGVPKVFSKVHDEVQKRINSSLLVKFAYNLSFNWKAFWKYYGYSTPLVDYLVFSKITSLFGGRMRITISAGAPLNAKVSDFLNVVVGDCFHGYGLSESTGLGLRTERTDHLDGAHWLRPYPSGRVKLINCPEMNYYVTDPLPRGEIALRGHFLMTGYYHDDEQTKVAIDEDGWFHTGDIGEMDSRGRIRIIDRKNSLFKLAQGEYISSELIEGYLTQSPYLTDVFVYGEPDKDFAVAVIVPTEQEVRKAVSVQNKALDFDELIKAPEVLELVLSEITRIATEENIRGFEIPKSVALSSVPFERLGNMVTPSLKLRRKPLSEHFAANIAQLYANPPMIASLSASQKEIPPKSPEQKKND